MVDLAAMRDAMRARELVRYLDFGRRSYVEAGPLHLGLVEQQHERHDDAGVGKDAVRGEFPGEVAVGRCIRSE